jgi:hypothetical protein
MKKKIYYLNEDQVATIIGQARTDDTICPAAKRFVEKIDKDYGYEDEEEDKEDIEDEEEDDYRPAPRQKNKKQKKKLLKWFTG